MKLKEQTIIKFLNTKVVHNVCDCCRQSSLTFDDKVFELREFTGGGLQVGGTAIAPYLTVTCGNCGYTRFFNLVVAGLMNQDGTLADD